MMQETGNDSTNSPFEEATMKAGMPRKNVPLLSQGLIGSERLVQKFERYDPWPSIPFYKPAPKMTLREKLIFAVFAVGVFSWILYLEVWK